MSVRPIRWRVLRPVSPSASPVTDIPQRRSTHVRLCWRQHCLEDDFDELLRKGQPRYADQIAGALRPRRGVGFFAHLARDRKRRIDIEDIERLFHYMVERCAEASQDF